MEVESVYLDMVEVSEDDFYDDAVPVGLVWLEDDLVDGAMVEIAGDELVVGGVIIDVVY